MLLRFNFKRKNGLAGLAAVAITGGLVASGFLPARAADAKDERPDLTGQVTNGEGEPVSGARVVIYSADVKEGTSPFCPTCYLDCGKRDVTDPSGRFRIESLDSSLLFRVLVVGKGYRPKFVEEVDPLGGALAITLDQPERRNVKPTRQIKGRVVDSEGSPISNAIVEVTATHEDLPGDGSRHWGGAMEGLDPLAVTDQHGDFRLTSSKDFISANVQVEAIRFAKRKVKLETGTKRQKVVLTKGATVTGRVVNNGARVAEVPLGLAAEERSLSELQFTGELIGRVVGDIDPFTILMEKGEPYERDDDYYRHVPDKYHVEQLPLQGMASWEDPSKSFTISGKVADARSGKPVDQFRVTPGRLYEGQSEAYWWRHRETQFKDGEYTVRFQRGPGKPMIRIRADGYYAATTSMPLTIETKHHDFKLTPMGLPTKAASSK